ncbi:Pycsar system effector family protein [uncultured Aeromicrobium sp.]|uniref:Pycsar system effector family protein n=1 Tax=uncultured Aeromicrobium sp. TaxID=337820 RepID=UPI0025EE75D8|nr:Pycsar system effector family protein [uncultured Aeromicrobium sp.]
MTDDAVEAIGPDGVGDTGDAVEETTEMAVEAIAGNPDQAWKMLGLVNDWIKHAETKAAGTIATSGVAAGVLYNLLKGVTDPGKSIAVPAAICAFSIVVAGLSAAWALRPRLWSREEPTSNLYFDHIARRHRRKAGVADYDKTVRALSAEAAALIGEIAGQIWANAHVARTKYRWAGIRLTAVLLALAALAATAFAIAKTSW